MAAMVLAVLAAAAALADKFDEDEYGVIYASDCEVCKLVGMELEALLGETDKKHGVIETGYSVEKEKKKTKVRWLFTECSKLYEYFSSKSF